MADWEGLVFRVQQVTAFVEDWHHLRGVLERDPLWQQRYDDVIAEPGRTQLIDSQTPLNTMDASVAQVEDTIGKFTESYASFKVLLDQGMEAPDHILSGYQPMIESSEVILETGRPICEMLIALINALRQAQQLPPLDGGLSPLN